MQFFKQWAISVCASGIIATVFSMIAPKGSMDKILKLMISVFIFTSMLVPFLTGEKIDFDDFISSSSQSVSEEELWERANQLTLKTAKASLEQSIGDFLNRHSLEEYEIEVSFIVDENNYITISHADLYLMPDDLGRSGDLKALTEQEFGITVNVFSIGEYENETN